MKTPCIVTHGLVPSLANFHIYLASCRYLSFIYYGFGLLLHIEYNGRTIYR